MQYQPYDYQSYAIDYIIGHPVAALLAAVRAEIGEFMNPETPDKNHENKSF